MRALEVRLNGTKLCIAGVGEDGVITAIVSCVLRNGKHELTLDTGGISNATQQHLRWHELPIEVGDKIQVTVIESSKVDEPETRKPMQVTETEQLQAEKQLVMQLVKKFGWKIEKKTKARTR